MTMCSRGSLTRFKMCSQRTTSLTPAWSQTSPKSPSPSLCARSANLRSKVAPGMSLVPSASSFVSMTRTFLWLESTSRTVTNTSTPTWRIKLSLNWPRSRACSERLTSISWATVIRCRPSLNTSFRSTRGSSASKSSERTNKYRC